MNQLDFTPTNVLSKSQITMLKKKFLLFFKYKETWMFKSFQLKLYLTDLQKCVNRKKLSS